MSVGLFKKMGPEGAFGARGGRKIWLFKMLVVKICWKYEKTFSPVRVSFACISPVLDLPTQKKIICGH